MFWQSLCCVPDKPIRERHSWAGGSVWHSAHAGSGGDGEDRSYSTHSQTGGRAWHESLRGWKDIKPTLLIYALIIRAAIQWVQCNYAYMKHQNTSSSVTKHTSVKVYTLFSWYCDVITASVPMHHLVNLTRTPADRLVEDSPFGFWVYLHRPSDERFGYRLQEPYSVVGCKARRHKSSSSPRTVNTIIFMEALCAKFMVT